LGTYIVAEVAENGWTLDPIEGLTAAKYHAAARARDSRFAVVVRDSDTGREVARFLPGRSNEAASNRPRARPSSPREALVRLRVANQRLQAIVASQSSPKKEPSEA
jgi:hypothetical protein